MSRTFFVTGAASGIGAALTKSLTEADHFVWATDIHHGKLQEQSKNWKNNNFKLLTLDVTDAKAWEHSLDRALLESKKLDVLLNVAGYVQPGYSYETPIHEVDRHIDINVKGLMYGSLEAARRMIKQGHGHIVNIASLAGLSPVPGMSLYSGSKFAVRGFSLAMALELKEKNINVSVLCPDLVRTPMLDKQLPYKEAALVFSGSRSLEVDEVVDAVINDILIDKPLEVALPRSRGWLCKTANLAPQTAALIMPALVKKGLRMQQKKL